MPSIATLSAGSARATGFYSLLGGDWAAGFTATGSTSFSHEDMAVAADGSIYVVGVIDNSTGSIMKLSSIGAVQWNFDITSNAGTARPFAVAARGASVYVAVMHSTTVSGLIKLNAADGSVVWSKTISNFVFQSPTDMLVDSSENIYVISNITVSGPYDGFSVQKFNSSGTFLAGRRHINTTSGRAPSPPGNSFLDEANGHLYVGGTGYNTATATNNLGPAVFRLNMSDLVATASASWVTSSAGGVGLFCAPNPTGGLVVGGRMAVGSNTYLFSTNTSAALDTTSSARSITFTGDPLTTTTKQLTSGFVDVSGVLYAAGHYTTSSGRTTGVLCVDTTPYRVFQSSAARDRIVRCLQHTDGSLVLQCRGLNTSNTATYNFVLKIPSNMTKVGVFTVGSVDITVVAADSPTTNSVTTFRGTPTAVSGADEASVSTTPGNATTTMGTPTTTVATAKL